MGGSQLPNFCPHRNMWGHRLGCGPFACSSFCGVQLERDLCNWFGVVFLDEKGKLELWMVLSCQTFVPIEMCGGIDLALDLLLVGASAVGCNCEYICATS